MQLHSSGRLLALPTNIRLRWKLKAVATLAYYDMSTVPALKSVLEKALLLS
jgi:hypothetical protein